MALPTKETIITEREKFPIVERPTTPEVGEIRDIKGIEPIMGEEISLPQPITDETGEILVETPTPQQIEIKLPLTEEQILRGLGYKIIDSFRWLAEWCKRLLKIVGGKFSYNLKQP